ncbi:hypothetical protein NBO_1147g0001 [Nosema bombycis CQ1]|uniref:Serpin domain-containing protein n=1 Tax=Nosema bombycis (strain CQ1 / CVCC 102059) TaxID=578461 RepID=R0M0E3_NOSB1|nr:hypothetical protein NBO_1147g0001 [Nosema bombycis CQ1]|eukprot:EOB11479.1 hypothetical protein NBO_1147g0001 [Nosema bombycis CQ1]
MVHFKDDWARKFDIEESYVGEYFSNETSVESRNFMYKHDNYFYKMIHDEVAYEIIAIPYSARKDEPYPRFMVYLVPVKHETDLSKVWDSFYAACNGDIPNFIKKQLYLRLVKLHIPKITELKSVFDLKVLLDMVFINNTVNSSSKITTCLNIDESGTKEVVVPFSLFDIVDFDFGSITVKANRPHLSFIFDMGIQRILFVVKDTGY